MDAHAAFPDSVGQLRAELDYLDLLLRRAVSIARAGRPSSDPEPLRGLVITEDTIDGLLDSLSNGEPPGPSLDALPEFEDEIANRRRDNNVRAAASLRDGRAPSFSRLTQLCGLGDAEAGLVLIALAPELDVRYETIYAYLQDDATRKRPGVAMALSLIGRSFEERIAISRSLAPSAPLIRLRVLELGEDAHERRPTLLRKFLKLDDSVLRFLLDQPPASTAGVKVVQPAAEAPEPSVSSRTRQTLKALLRGLDRSPAGGAVLHLLGPAEAPLKEVANAIGSSLRRPLLIVDTARLTEDPDLEGAIVRDAILWNALPVLPGAHPAGVPPDRPQASAAERQLLSRLHEVGRDAIVLWGDELHRFPPRARLWRLTVEPPDAAERRHHWAAIAHGRYADADLDRLADMFPFGAARIGQAMALAHTRAALRDPDAPEPTVDDLVSAGRAFATPNLQRFAVVASLRYDWDDLVLPDDRKRQLRTVAARVANRQTVHRDWGFGEKLSRGRGVAVLFSGPPGTGKTMAAEVLAQALCLELFQIDLSTVVSKYVGEAEKQLSAIFAEAERCQCVLFFDECDAIFGKRTEVKDAHDRYANTEVNYLLQRLEQYDGIVLLATNFQKNIDEAFLRRLHDSIEFPFPDDDAREQIWRKQFPKQAPVDPALDFAFVAKQFKLPGGNIRNAALYAAFLAAENGGRGATIGMEHVLEGVRREFQKQGKLVMASDMGGYGERKRLG
jgi:SpoVK/Ycf46/Vps4 family AAA+-type ATPase